jgi:uncharacterized membrane protein YbhN (UPF0104 family)
VAEGLVLAAFLGFLVWSAVRQWDRVSEEIGELSALPLLAATGAALAAAWCGFLAWRAVLADLGSQVALSAGMRIFFVGQLGKYLPGAVWPLLAQVRLGRDHQVPRRASAATVLIIMAISVGTGLLVALLSLPALDPDAFGRYRWVWVAAPLVALAIWPPLLNRSLARLLRLLRREPMPKPLSLGGIARSVGWSLAMWLLYGAHLWALLAAGTGADPNLLLGSVGAFAGAWAIGFLLVLAPAGIGAREVALVVLLGATVPQPAALVAAVVSRLLMTGCDLVLGLAAMALGRARPARTVSRGGIGRSDPRAGPSSR